MRSCVYCKRRYKKDSHISFHRLPKGLEEKKIWLQNMKTHNWSPKKYNYLCALHFNDECFVKHFNRTALKPGSIPTIFEGTSTFASSPHPSMSTSSPRPSTSTSSPRPSTSTSSPRSTASTSLPGPLTTNHLHTSNFILWTLACTILALQMGTKNSCQTYGTASPVVIIESKRDQEQAVLDHDYEVSSTPKKARIEVGLLHDHCYEITPRSLKTVAQQTRRSLKFAKAKAKTLSQRVRRLKLKITSLKNIVNDLIKKNKVSEECVHMLQPSVYDKLQEFLHFGWAVPNNVNETSKQCVGYIAGFVIRAIRNKITCINCLSACESIPSDAISDRRNGIALIIQKNRSGLTIPSQSVVYICLLVESLFRQACKKTNGKPPVEKSFPAVLTAKVMKELLPKSNTLFPELRVHFLETMMFETLNSHFDVLIKQIIIKYIDVRFFAATKNYSLSISGQSIRNFLTRQIIWARQ
ncbi:uncharacterized protein LOC110381786 [Helicoverpa armigera]|uniref:uncharacterized protein LOC110381786 n=1 Tax=Helicoverpa armigera TaxID=29058 RepID=UPI00308331D0